MSHILVIDPAVRSAETDCFNRLVALSPVKLTYHLPGLFGTAALNSLPSEPSGIIILGSSSSVHDKLEWQEPLNRWIIRRIENNIPVFGICYGHQMLAHILGGTIGYLYATKEKSRGFREVTFSDNPLWGRGKKGQLFASHREVVTHCPPSMKVTATSAVTPIEGLAHEKKPVWSVQTHPEATPSLVASLGGGQKTSPEDLKFGWKLLEDFFARYA